MVDLAAGQGPQIAPLDADERRALRRVARKTWRFFDTFVVERGHHLAPDNYQEDPGGMVAWRTSPTNIGLQLLSYANAYDLGYLTVRGLNSRVAATLTAMAGLERFRGHFYNWYDIETLAPLRPAYVSTVDSGNLAGHLLVLRIALLEASESPLLAPQLLAGARDAVLLALEDLVAEQAALPSEIDAYRLREALDALARMLEVAEYPTDLGEWSVLLDRFSALADQIESAIGGVETSPRPEGGPRFRPHPTSVCMLSVADAVAAIRRPQTLLDEYAPWARLLTDVPNGLHGDASLEPLLTRVPSLVGLAEGLERGARRARPHRGGPGPDHDWATTVAGAFTRAARPQSNCSPGCGCPPRSPARCGSTPTSRCCSTRTASSSRSATTSTKAGSIRATTTCSPASAASRASSRSRRATSASSTGSVSAGR